MPISWSVKAYIGVDVFVTGVYRDAVGFLWRSVG
jgi:hypothetical protein